MDFTDQNLDQHIKKVEKAINKINNNQELENFEINELFKSLMNAQIMVSEKQDELEKKIRFYDFFGEN
tara:strand:+ start:309 stop:512 length:204 start_codon:yes stop_codon:yes gene_type:complete